MLLSSSCKKEVDQFIPFFESVEFDFSSEFTGKEDTLTFELSGLDRMTLTTPIGTEFILKGGMFQYADGTSCACEKIVVQIIELDKKRDYVVHQTPTVAKDQLLISAGAYHIAAFHEGKALQMIPEEQLCLVLPAKDPDSDMKLYYGSDDPAGFTWLPADEVPGSRAFVMAGEWQTDSSLIIGYECFSDRLGWINIDKLASDGPKNPVCIKLDDFHTGQNTVVFAVVPEERSILSLYYNLDEDGFCLSNIPVGLEVLFIAVSKKDEDLYELATEQVVISKNHFQSLTFETKSFDEIKNFLLSL